MHSVTRAILPDYILHTIDYRFYHAESNNSCRFLQPPYKTFNNVLFDF